MLRSFMDKINVIKNTVHLKQYSLPAFIFLILVSLSIVAYYSQSAHEIKNLRNMMAENSASIQYTVELRLNERLSALQRMASRWSAGNGTPKKVWEIDAKNYVDSLPGLKTLEWIDRKYNLRWVIPLENNENKIGTNNLLDKTFIAMNKGAIKKNVATVSQPLKLPQGYFGFVSLYPVKAYGVFDGFLVGIFDINDFFTEALSYYSNQYYTLSLRYNGSQYFSNNHAENSKTGEGAFHTKLKFFDKQWDLIVEPSQETISLYKSHFPIAILIFGLLFSVLVTFIISNLLSSRTRSRALAKANFLINIILQSTDHLIIATDVDGVVTLFNKAAEKTLGYSAEEIIGKQTPAIWHDLNEVAARAAVLTEELGIPILPGFDVFVMKAKIGITETIEWTLIRKDGSCFPARLTPTSLSDNGQIIGYLGILEDITEQKNAEREIKELKTAMDNAVEGTAKLDPSGRYTFVNEAYAKTVGYKPEELVGTQWELTVHPDDQAFMQAEYKRMLEVGKVSPEARGVRKDGSIFYKQLTMISNIDEKGVFRGHYCFMKDISERIESEKQTALLAAIVEFSEDAMICKNLDGTITAWNKGAENLFGYQSEEILGKNIRLLIPTERLEEEKNTLESVRKGNSIQQKETIRVGKNREQIHVSLTISPVYDKNGTIIGASTVVRDITKRRQQEKEMELLTEKLLESNTELERFAYIASHDLQEPIRMVTNFSEILAKDYTNVLDDEGKEYLKFVIDAGIRMRDMIDDLLSYSRLASDDDRMKAFKGESIMRELEENLKTLLIEKKVKITHDKLPELYGNPVQILRLLQNLVVNGIKYQPIGNIPAIHVSAQENAEYWCISVQDNGLGIKPEFINIIFQPFKRLHTWDSISGTGLGLAICKKIAENHGGSIDVKSTFGKGSIFSFLISKQLKQRRN